MADGDYVKSTSFSPNSSNNDEGDQEPDSFQDSFQTCFSNDNTPRGSELKFETSEVDTSTPESPESDSEPRTLTPTPHVNNSKSSNNGSLSSTPNSQSPIKSVEEARKIGEETVDQVIALAEKADELKEHDVIDEETKEADRIQSELDKELEENDGWVKILGNEELMKKVIKPGIPNVRPMRGDICTIRIEGRLASDESVVFEKDENFQMQLGDAEVIPGLDLSIPLMTKGETALLKVAHRFGYGSKGLTTFVPPRSNLIYEIELLNFENEKELEELSVTERRSIGNRKRERGNWWYGRNESALAVQSYRRALEFLDEVEGGVQFSAEGASQENSTPEIRELFEDRLKTLNNMAAAQLKLQAFEPALSSVEAVLKCQPNNVKALYRKGKILGEKGETEKAIKVLQRARALDPNEKSFVAELNRLSQRRKEEHQSEKQLYKRMFKDSPTKDKSSGDKDEEKNGSSGLKSTLSMGLALSGVAIAVAGVMAYRAFRPQ